MEIKGNITTCTNEVVTIDFSHGSKKVNEKSNGDKVKKSRIRGKVSKTVYCYSVDGYFLDQGPFEYFLKNYGLIRSTINSGIRKRQLVRGKYFFSFNLLTAQECSLEFKPARRNRKIICLDLHLNLIITGTLSYLACHVGLCKSSIGHGIKYLTLVKKRYFFFDNKLKQRVHKLIKNHSSLIHPHALN